jgi:hypothetical protein
MAILSHLYENIRKSWLWGPVLPITSEGLMKWDRRKKFKIKQITVISIQLQVRRADNLAAIYEPNVWKCGASISRNPKGLQGPYWDNFTFTIQLELHNKHYYTAKISYNRIFIKWVTTVILISIMANWGMQSGRLEGMGDQNSSIQRHHGKQHSTTYKNHSYMMWLCVGKGQGLLQCLNWVQSRHKALPILEVYS